MLHHRTICVDTFASCLWCPCRIRLHELCIGQCSPNREIFMRPWNHSSHAGIKNGLVVSLDHTGKLHVRCFFAFCNFEWSIQSHECRVPKHWFVCVLRGDHDDTGRLEKAEGSKSRNGGLLQKRTKRVMNTRALEKKLRHCGQNLNSCCFCLGGDACI